MTADATLLKRWPEHLIEQVAARNFVLVIGAGASKSCVNASGKTPPNWEELLNKLIATHTAGISRTAAKSAVARGDYLEAAELLRVKAKAKGKEQDFLSLIAEQTDGGQRTEQQFQPSSLHGTLLRLDPHVLITTNYDKILERATSNGYKLHMYNSTNLGSELRAGSPLLIKIHGTVDHSQDLILTRSDYTRLRREGAHALEVVQALLLTRPALFIGYSFSDPDVHLILENILGATGSVPSHYLLTGDSIPQHVREIYGYCYGTSVVSFTSGDFGEMNRMLELLAEAVEIRKSASA
jgi:hypothetical protein